MITDAIIKHLYNFKLINSSQLGFVKNKSCLTNLLQFIESITNVVDQGLPVDIIYLEFQKAFDEVPQKIVTEIEGAWHWRYSFRLD